MGLKIIQHNVLDIHRRKAGLLAQYNEYKPDIILLSSVGNLRDCDKSTYGYNTLTKSLTNETSDGSMILIKKGLDYKEIDTDSRLQCIEVTLRHIKITIVTAYFPPRYPTIDIAELQRLTNVHTPVIIAGDFNATHPFLGHTDTNVIGKTLGQFNTRGSIQFIGPDFPTWFKGRKTGRPDIVLTNNKTPFRIDMSPGPQTASDHIPIIIDVDADPVRRIVPPRPVIDAADWDEINARLTRTPAPNLQGYNAEQLDQITTDLLDRIKATTDELIPKRHTATPATCKPSHRSKEIEVALQRLIDQIRTQPQNEHILSRQYIVLRNELLDQLQKDNSAFFTKLIMNAKDKGPRQYWTTINRFQGKNKRNNTPIRDENDQPIITYEELEPKFRTHFINQFQITPQDERQFDQHHAKIIKDEHTYFKLFNKPPKTVDLQRLCHDDFTNPVQLEEFKIILKKMSNKAPGPSGITRKLLLYLHDNVLQRFVDIYNASLSISHFPTPFKHAHIVPIHKTSKPKTITNHRPISLLEITGKIFERILTYRLNIHLTDNNILQNPQHGFRSFRGTDTALGLAYEFISRHKNTKPLTLSLRDVQGAFDKVWIPGIKVKLQRLDLPIPFTHLLSNYLDNRTASCKIFRDIGIPFQLAAGVPQGAILSPTLYNIYLSDLPTPPPLGRFTAHNTIYADDITQIIYTHFPLQAQQKAVATRSDQINIFEAEWKIKTNISKFNILPLWKTHPESYRIHNIDITPTNQATFLGLTINRTTGLKTHIEANCLKAALALSKLYKYRDLPTRTKLTLYKILVRPILTYPAIILSATEYKTHMYQMQKIQNRATYLITNTSRLEHRTLLSLHEDLKLEPINIFLHRVATKAWDKIHEHFPTEYESLANRRTNTCTKTFPSSLNKIDLIPAPFLTMKDTLFQPP